MKYNFLFFLLFFLCSCVKNNNIFFNVKNSTEIDKNNFDYFLETGKFDSARDYIDSIFNIRSTDLDVLKKRGEIYFLLNNFEIAESSWQNCLLLDSSDVVCHEKLIALYCGFENLKNNDCNDILERTLILNPDNQIASYFKAKRLVEINKKNEAIILYKNLLEKDSKNIRVMNELAQLYDTNFQSEIYYKRILKLDSSYVAFYGLGMYYQKKKLYNKAIKNYQDALAVFKRKEPYYNLGFCHLMKNETSEAIDFFSKAINLDASYLEAYFARAYSYSLLNKKELAVEDYKFCLMLEPGFEDARIELEKINK